MTKPRLRLPKVRLKQLKEIRERAAFSTANFGGDESKVRMTKGFLPAGVLNDIIDDDGNIDTSMRETGYPLDMFLKAATRPYRASWLLPLIDDMIAWGEGR